MDYLDLRIERRCKRCGNPVGAFCRITRLEVETAKFDIVKARVQKIFAVLDEAVRKHLCPGPRRPRRRKRKPRALEIRKAA